MRLRGRISVFLAFAIFAILVYFSWPPTITGLAGFTAGTEANLTVWDETDNESFEYANQTRYPGDIVFFFANYTNATDGTILNDTIANCSINFSTEPTLYNMTFNVTKLLWEFNSTFSTSNPNYNFSVNCSAPATAYDNLTATDNFTISDNITPSLVVSSPVNGTLYGTALIDLNFTATDDYLIDSCWYTNVNGTNITLSGCANTTITANEGSNNITVYVNDTSNNTNSTEIFFSVDTTAPSITIINPINNSVFYTDNISLEYTVFDANLDKCWYELSNSSIYDLPSCANTTIVLPQGGWTLRVWANDTLGNTNSTPFVNFTIWTQFVTVCSFGCNFTNINDALAYVNGTSFSVLVYEPGTYLLNNSYLVIGNITISPTVLSTTISIPIAIFLAANSITFNCAGNTLYGLNTSGALVSTANDTIIENCIFNNHTIGAGTYLANNAIIRNNTVYNSAIGFGGFSSNYINITNNRVINTTSAEFDSGDPGGVGIGFVDGLGNSISNNYVSVINNYVSVMNLSELQFGIVLFASNHTIVFNNYVTGGLVGFISIGANESTGNFDNQTFFNNTATLNGVGFAATSIDYAAFVSNNATMNILGGFYITHILLLMTGNVTYVNLTNNIANNNDIGIKIEGGSNLIVANNTANYNNISLYIDVTSDSLIEGNSLVFGNLAGIMINSSP